ncbi:MAG: lipid-A-disaccharide synthase [Sphingobacteriales bacterium]|nr:MAG: lipid-A-disaccharide synthase [Sphingobacteriales bacterium]
MRRYYIIAGEASGDLHGAGLIRALAEREPQAAFRAWGGDRMEAAGATLVKHYRDLAFMGFVEVIKHLGTILRNIRFAKEDILAFRPDVLILIDYPGFNMRIAKWAKEQGIRVVYYISPQIWAWKEGRVHALRRDVDQMLVILPFEKPFYQKHGMEVDYVGHPLIQTVAAQQAQPVDPSLTFDKPVIALLPGSRAQEIEQKLPRMLSVVKHFPQYQFVVAAAPAQPVSLYESLTSELPVQIVSGKTYPLLQIAQAALVTSGTATLETALFGVPQIVCYRGNPISYQLAKRLIKVKYISLVNLILDKPAVPELIQDALNESNLTAHLKPLLSPESVQRQQMLAEYRNLWTLLGSIPAAEEAAQLITDALPEPSKNTSL